MTSEQKLNIALLIGMSCFMFMVGFLFGFERGRIGYERKLYNHQLGTYNPNNGEFIPIWEKDIFEKLTTTTEEVKK